MVPRPVLTPGWSNAYVSPPVPFLIGGRDRAGWDCWGLLRCVYAEQMGIELPAMAGEYAGVTDHAAFAALFEREVSEWVQVDRPHEGDAVWMRILGQPCHVGVWLPGPGLLHVLVGSGTRVDRISSPSWQRRVLAYYRHRSRATQ